MISMMQNVNSMCFVAINYKDLAKIFVSSWGSILSLDFQSDYLNNENWGICKDEEDKIWIVEVNGRILKLLI